ncbi:MAG TPA: hypothetical protein PKM73_05550 [Verrucomicrobiota bacterium]|nr:hypothetical protein [Verrucomicrobiota bacterium]
MPVDLDEARAWLACREERRQRALDLRFAEAWSDLRRIVRAIVGAYPIQVLISELDKALACFREFLVRLSSATL